MPFLRGVLSKFVSMLDIKPCQKYNLYMNFIERSQIMKKTVKIILPIVLAIAIVICAMWYLFVYDRVFTRDLLLTFARFSERNGSHSVAAWFYNQAYAQSADSEAVAIELAEQYKAIGNFTKAEFTLSNAIADGGGIDLYIALCKTYIEQDKVLDAVNMLDRITNESIKDELSQLRPAMPTVTPEPGFYNQYINVTLTAESGTLYVSTTDKYPSIKKDLYSEPISMKDGENTVYAVALAENGLVSPLGIFGYTIGGVIEKMEFADSTVEASVRDLLGVGADKELFTNDLWTITNYTVPSGAANYADLKHMPFLESLTIENGTAEQLKYISAMSNLTELKISNTVVSQDELTIIGSLPKLKALTLHNCKLSGIAPLKTATALEYLDLSGNTFRSIDAISVMTALKELYLQNNAIIDLTAISSCTALKKLDVSSNALTSLVPISNLTALTWLNAGTNSISDLGEIDKLSSMTVLKLNNNKLTDTGALSGCTTLVDLDLSTNELTDITSLSTLDELMYFDFSYNQVTEIPNFDTECALVTINGSHNQISSLTALGGLAYLNHVHMDYNTEISSVKDLANCRRLVEVNVYETKVTDVTPLTNQSIIVNYKPV